MSGVPSNESFDELVNEAAVERGLPSGLVSKFISARLSHSNAGNRRPLFARFDQLLDSFEPTDYLPPTTGSLPRSPLIIRSIELRNWKIFEHVLLEFPSFDPHRPVVLIGGKNGFGKTSLLEALLFGLFGRRALLEIDKALWMENSSEVQTAARSGYRLAIERAFHAPARSRGEGIASVVIGFESAAGPLSVERRWYFDESGSFVEEDEELVVREGSDAHVVPVGSDNEINEYYQDEIARRILPPSLAPFFFFDGEQIRRLGERHLAEQMRLGLESVLGIYRLRETVADLRAYLRDRTRDGEADRAVSRLQDDLAALRGEEAEILEGIERNEGERGPLRERRDELLRQLGTIAGGTFANLQTMLEKRRQLEAERSRVETDLAAEVANNLPAALIGKPLIAQLRGQLSDEAAHEALRAGDAVRADLEAFLMAFEAIEPPLARETATEVHRRIRQAWSQPTDFEDERPTRHHYLYGRPRDGVFIRLDQMEPAQPMIAAGLARRLEEICADHAALCVEIDRRQQLEIEEPGLRAELERTIGALDEVIAARRELDQRLGEIRGRLAPKHAEQERKSGARRDGTLQNLRVERAAAAIEAIETAIARGTPAHFDSFAAAVTENYRSLAHKGTIQAIRLLADGNVVLIGANGAELDGVTPSAGESQIFAMALIAAVADITELALPIVIDTPLGRLDPDHRERMLSHFTGRDGQVVLLSQPDEVNGRYLSLIQDRVAVAYHLEYQVEDRASHSRANKGYFPMLAA